MFAKAKLWFHGMRGPFLIASAIPVIFGGALASLYTVKFDWALFILTLLGIVTMHAAANMSNEYFDYKNKTDVVNKHRTIFSGGSGFLVSGELKLGQYKKVFLSLYAVTFVIGAFLFFSAGKNGWIIITLALGGFLLTHFYSSPPIAFAHRGLGELIVGLCFGPLPIFGTFLLLTGKASLIPIIASIPLMMLIIAVLWINQFPDVEADTYANKKNLVIRMGPEGARSGYYLLVGIAYAAIPLLIVSKYIPWYSVLALLTIPVALKASIILKKSYDKPKDVFPAMGLTILNHHVTGILLIGGLLIERFFG